MTDVLITHSYFYRLDTKQWRFHQPYPPLGTLQAAAVLREKNYSVSFFDVGLQPGPGVITQILDQNPPQFLVIYDDGFNYLTKMCLTVMRDAAFHMAVEAKKKGVTVIINSSDATDHYDLYFQHGVDFVIRGEGEETLVALLDCLKANQRPVQISGLAFPDGGQTRLTPPRSVMKDLDSLPMPAWDLLDVNAYRKIWEKYHGYFSLNLATTRGCPFKCNWCAKPIYGNRYHSRSPEHVVREIAWLMEHHRPDHFWMSDDIFGLKPGWVQSFNNKLKEKKLKVRYKIQSRADLLLEENTILALAQSGAETVWVGAESGSQKILDAMDKGTTIGQIEKARMILKQHGIRTAFFLQFGYLGETRKDIHETIKMVLRLMPEEIGISVSYPLPGTKFYDTVKERLSTKRNWKDSGDLDMLFPGLYPPAFYKILHRYTHGRYRVQRGLNMIGSLFSRPTLPTFGHLKTIVSMVYHAPLTILYGSRLMAFHLAHAPG
jgi:anaerobic magnesium-protoporphyrin IX monomethyl ester cyclase